MFEGRATAPTTRAHEVALDCLAAGIEAAQPATAVRRHCSVDDGALRVRAAEYDCSAYEEVLLVGGGKGSDGLAAGLVDLLDDTSLPLTGVVVTDARTADPAGATVLVGDHPTPGEGSVAGAEAVLDRATAADSDTLVLAPVTGGGSALLCAPLGDLTASDLAAVTDGLLAAGAPVDEINVVRRACSRIKGGGLAAAAAPATVVGLVVSDVVGDDPGVVASGPTVPQATDPAAAVTVLDRHAVEAPAVRTFLDGAEPRPAPDAAVDTYVIASAPDAVDAASRVAADRGYDPCVLTTRLEGEAREAGRFHAAVATEIVADERPIEPPAVLLSGGETTVTVDRAGDAGDGDGGGTAAGDGGPNLEFVVGCGLDLPASGVVAAVDTDGHDGSTDAAGAILAGDALSTGDPPADRTAGDPDPDHTSGDPDGDVEAARRALATNDTLPFLAGRGAVLETGSTGTNVNDLRIVVLDAKPF